MLDQPSYMHKHTIDAFIYNDDHVQNWLVYNIFTNFEGVLSCIVSWPTPTYHPVCKLFTYYFCYEDGLGTAMQLLELQLTLGIT